MDSPLSPIAIIGIGCRFPGGASTPEKLWELLADGRSAWTKVPEDRFNEESFIHPNADNRGAHNHRGGHFLRQDVGVFDAEFFGISPAEAKAMDPQQRLLLETTYEALENGGIPIESVRGSNTGVFAAIFSRDYDRDVYRDTLDIPQYHVTGCGDAILANRISYVFDLKGPSITMDTGCSGSMVALHQACQSLRSHESDLALAAGANLILGPDHMIAMSNLHMLNDEGKTFAFDDRGSGYGRGEGVATVVLKRLGDALREGDPIRAVIRGTAVNQDGKTAGITRPSPEAQEQLETWLYQKAGLNPADIGYVEAHGTGTAAGDEAEMQAISNVFCRGREDSLYVGSLKSIIGHLEASSGLAGLIKAVLVVENKMIPPNANFQSPKATLLLDERNIKVPLRLQRWHRPGIPRVSVNSFGYGGTNAHCIIERAPDLHETTTDEFLSAWQPTNDNPVNEYHPERHQPNGHLSKKHPRNESLETGQPLKRRKVNGTLSHLTPPPSPATASSPAPVLITLSASSRTSAAVAAKCLQECLAWRPPSDSDLIDLAYTLSGRRSKLRWRFSCTATDHSSLMTALTQESLHQRIHKAYANVSVIYCFTGQGSQWAGMGRELLSTRSAFTDSISRSTRLLTAMGASWNLVEEIMRDTSVSRINDGEIAQPATTALQIALVDLLSSLGIRPETVVGHSSGEIGAAYAAGILSHRDALQVSFSRGFVSRTCRKKNPVKGAMLAVGLGEDEVVKYVTQIRPGTISIACSNSPKSTTISGDEESVLQLKTLLDGDSIFNRMLQVDTAYHSHHVRAASKEYNQSLNSITTSAPLEHVRFISTVTGYTKRHDFGPLYWVENLVSKVRFSHAVQEYCRLQQIDGKSPGDQRRHQFIEIGPHGTLSGPTKQTIKISAEQLDHDYQSCLSRNTSAMQTVLNLAGKLFEIGAPVDISAVNSFSPSFPKPKVVNDLPAYSWDHSKRYWHEPYLSRDYKFRKHPYHDLLGVRIPGSTTVDPRWRQRLSLETLPWLREHVIDAQIIFPGSGYLTMVVEAVRQLSDERNQDGKLHNICLRDVSFLKALVVPDSPEAVEMQLSLTSELGKLGVEELMNYNFRITALSGATWHVHCHGRVTMEFEASKDRQFIPQKSSSSSRDTLIEDALQDCRTEINPRDLYRELKSNGNDFGTNFSRALKYVIGQSKAVAHVDIPNVADTMPSKFLRQHLIHPTTLDALMHTALPLFTKHHGRGSIMPVSIAEMNLSTSLPNTPGQQFKESIEIQRHGLRSAGVEITVYQRTDLTAYAQEPAITITGLELRGIGQISSVDSRAKNHNITSHIQWAPDADFVTQSSLDLGNLDAHEVRKAEHKLDLLNQAAAYYIEDCLVQIANKSLEVDALHSIKLLDWMKRTNSSNMRATSPDTRAHILADVPKCGVEGELLARVGPQLSSILSGTLNSLQLMLNDGLLYRVYQDDSSRRCYSHLEQYMKSLCFKNPHMTVLEVGAGTGGTTGSLLKAMGREHALPRRYDFTDLSAGFFDRARELLRDWVTLVNFKTLDISQDPIHQGFKESTYDLVVASNVLHATSEIQKTLQNIYKLLKPGGKLVLIEVTQPQTYLNATFGTLSGWWEGVADGRIDSPLLSRTQWQAALSTASMDMILSLKDLEGGAHVSSLMVAEASSKAEPSTHAPQLRILLSEPTPAIRTFYESLCTSLTTAGMQSIVTEWDEGPLQGGVTYVVIDSGEKPLMGKLSKQRFQQILELAREGTNVFWISTRETLSSVTNAEKALITGFSRTAHAENSNLNMITLDVQQSLSANLSELTQIIAQILLKAFGGMDPSVGKEREYVYRDGCVLIPRVQESPQLADWMRKANGLPNISAERYSTSPIRLSNDHSGALDGLQFVDDELHTQVLNDYEVKISAQAWSVSPNSLCLLRTQNNLTQADVCAGIITRCGSKVSTVGVGDSVCTLGGASFSSYPHVSESMVQLVPPSVSISRAASIPLPYMTALYALQDLADLQAGQSVLVHPSNTDNAYAAIFLAHAMGARAFATACTDEEQVMLTEITALPQENIVVYEKSLKTKIMGQTDGKGIDILFQCSSDMEMEHVTGCVKRHGTIIKIKALDTGVKKQHHTFVHEMDDANFMSFSLESVVLSRPQKARSLLASVMKLASETLPLHNRQVLPMSTSSIQEAIRIAQSGNVMDQAILESGKETTVEVARFRKATAVLDGNATYVIAGGAGDLGQRFCQLMARRGARNIVIMSRSIQAPSRAEQTLKSLREIASNVTLHHVACDISNEMSVKQSASHLSTMGLPPVKGVVHSAMQLQDRTLDKMTFEDFQIPLQTKLRGTQNLHAAFQHEPLDFFVLLSSAAGLLGTPGQSNYVSGNVFQDAFAQAQARNSSLSSCHYMSLDLGLVADAAVNTPEIERALQRQGLIPIQPVDLLAFFEYAISAQARQDRCTQAIIGFDTDSISDAATDNNTAGSALFSHMRRRHEQHSSLTTNTANVGDAPKTTHSLASQIDALGDDGHAIRKLIAAAIARKVASLMALEDMQLDMTGVSLLDLGLDSLVGLELRNWIMREFGVTMQPFEILEEGSVASLAGTVAERRSRVVVDEVENRDEDRAT